MAKKVEGYIKLQILVGKATQLLQLDLHLTARCKHRRVYKAV